MVSQVDLIPEGGGLAIVLRGDLAEILRFVAGKKNPDVLSEAGALNDLLSQGSLVAGTCTNQNLRGPQLEMVAGPGSNLNLHDSQVKMVAGARNHLKLRLSARELGAVANLASTLESGLFRAAA